MATCHAVHPFNATHDAEALRKAMKGVGTDEDAIIKVLCKRSCHQRQEIKKEFKQMYGRDLIDDLKSELSGNFEKVMVALMLPHADYDATCIHNAVKGLGTNDDTLIEILASRTNEEILEIKAAYKRLFKKDLEKAIEGDCSGDYMRLLIQLQNAGRDPEGQVNEKKAHEDAKKIHDACEGAGTDEETLRMIFATRSWDQLEETFKQFKILYKKDINDAIKGELSFNFKQAMLAIISCARNRPDFFAERLHKTMKGAGTDENALTRLVASRCEKDMVQVKECFHRRYGKPLEVWIKDDVKGDYYKALIALL